MALSGAEQAHVDAIAVAVAATMAAKVPGAYYIGSELGRKLVDDIVTATLAAAMSEDFSDLAS